MTCKMFYNIWSRGETTSIMGTHDTETENFFKGENVFGRRDISPNDIRSNDIWPKWSTDVVTVLWGQGWRD
jgi:hypothetical protein